MIQRGRFKVPPVPERADGEQRRAGFEIEFCGLTLEEAAAAVEAALGGTRGEGNAAEQRIGVDSFGEFRVELDWRYLREKAREAGAAEAEGREGAAEWVAMLSEAACLLVPVEVICPPIPIDRLSALQPLITALRDAGAAGTEDSLLAAYGVHINVEPPRIDAPTLHAYLRAFSLLQWWLVDANRVDITRRITPFVDLYPEEYVKAILLQEDPDLDGLSRAYLEHNPTRNRALDMLPLLATLDEARVQRAVEDPLVGPRPAFHYRLPNCSIERPDWSLEESWNLWRVVECLAASPDDLNALGSAFLNADRPLLGVPRAPWVKRIETWLNDRGLA